MSDDDAVHEAHMMFGQAAMAANDAIDAEVLEQMLETNKAVAAFIDTLLQRDLPAPTILGMIVGMTCTPLGLTTEGEGRET